MLDLRSDSRSFSRSVGKNLVGKNSKFRFNLSFYHKNYFIEEEISIFTPLNILIVVKVCVPKGFLQFFVLILSTKNKRIGSLSKSPKKGSRSEIRSTLKKEDLRSDYFPKKRSRCGSKGPGFKDPKFRYILERRMTHVLHK